MRTELYSIRSSAEEISYINDNLKSIVTELNIKASVKILFKTEIDRNPKKIKAELYSNLGAMNPPEFHIFLNALDSEDISTFQYLFTPFIESVERDLKRSENRSENGMYPRIQVFPIENLPGGYPAYCFSYKRRKYLVLPRISLTGASLIDYVAEAIVKAKDIFFSTFDYCPEGYVFTADKPVSNKDKFLSLFSKERPNDFLEGEGGVFIDNEVGTIDPIAPTEINKDIKSSVIFDSEFVAETDMLINSESTPARDTLVNEAKEEKLLSETQPASMVQPAEMETLANEITADTPETDTEVSTEEAASDNTQKEHSKPRSLADEIIAGQLTSDFSADTKEESTEVSVEETTEEPTEASTEESAEASTEESAEESAEKVTDAAEEILSEKFEESYEEALPTARESAPSPQTPQQNGIPYEFRASVDILEDIPDIFAPRKKSRKSRIKDRTPKNESLTDTSSEETSEAEQDKAQPLAKEIPATSEEAPAPAVKKTKEKKQKKDKSENKNPDDKNLKEKKSKDKNTKKNKEDNKSKEKKSEKEKESKEKNDSAEKDEKKPSRFKRFIRNLIPMKGDNKKEIIRKIVVLTAVAVFLTGAFLLLKFYVIDPAVNEANMEHIREIYHSASTQTVTKEVVDENGNVTIVTTEEKATGDWEAVKKINKEIVGWVMLDGTEIDYPVLYHKGDHADSYYYLYKDYNKKYSDFGSIFIDYRCPQAEESKHVVLHGHNMGSDKDAMFGSLVRYTIKDGRTQANPNYYKKHAIVSFDTPKTDGDWVIFAVMKIDVSNDNKNIFDFLKSEFDNNAQYLNFIYNIKERSYFDINVPINENDRLLTLSTCSYESDNMRTVVVARKIRPNEDVSQYVNKAKGKTPASTVYSSFVKEFDNIKWYDGNAKPVGDDKLEFLPQSEMFTVKFYNAYGKVIRTEKVLKGEDAVGIIGAPPVKKSDGKYNYRFIGWDKSYENVTKDLEIRPVYDRSLIPGTDSDTPKPTQAPATKPTDSTVTQPTSTQAPSTSAPTTPPSQPVVTTPSTTAAPTAPTDNQEQQLTE